MTTVAFDGRTLAADRQCTSANLRRQTTTKILRAGDYWYVGAGRQDDIAHVTEWLQGGALPDKRPSLEDDGGQGIAVRISDGAAFVVQGKRPVLSPALAPLADGSGRDFAIAAMALGKSAREAVRLASRFDVYTGSEVDVVRVGPPRGTRSKERPMITWDSFIEQIAQYEPPAAAVAVGADIAHAFREQFLRLRVQPAGRAFVRGVPVFVDHELPRDGFRALREVPE